MSIKPMAAALRAGQVLLVLLALAAVAPAREAAASVKPGHGAPLDSGSAWYPRIIRLEHSGPQYNGRIIVSTNTGTVGTFHESVDGGRSFQPISQIHTQPGAGHFSCCSALFEFPVQMGASPAGTLIWATSINSLGGGDGTPNPNARIVAWKSADHGGTWVPLAQPIVTASTDKAGVWEPEFSEVGGDLVMHFSDKSQRPTYGQTLARVRSTDGGQTWGAKVNTVAVAATAEIEAADSPGMPVVRRLPNGTYFMVYEYCNIKPVLDGGHGCRVYYRTSPDGWNWGDPTDRGTIVRAVDGKLLAHAPTIAWAPGGGPNGRLLLIARLVKTGGDYGKTVTNKALSGTTILASTSNGVGGWYEIDSPVQIVGFRDEQITDPAERDLVLPCQNYSSALLPSADGTGVLEVATEVAGDTCKAYYASGPTVTATPVSTSTPYDVLNVKSRKCLEGVKSEVNDLTEIAVQSTCGGGLAQQWRAVSRGNGEFAFVNTKWNKCLDVPNGNISVDPGDKVQLWQCNGTAAQTWVPAAVGRSAYLMKAKNNPALCLDIPHGSPANGVQAQVVACNGLGAQLWYLRPAPSVP